MIRDRWFQTGITVKKADYVQPVRTLNEKQEDFSIVPIGLQAAMTVHLACSEVTIPALEIEILCCSMASWILVLSASFIWRRESSDDYVFTATVTTYLLQYAAPLQCFNFTRNTMAHLWFVYSSRILDFFLIL